MFRSHLVRSNNDFCAQSHFILHGIGIRKIELYFDKWIIIDTDDTHRHRLRSNMPQHNLWEVHAEVHIIRTLTGVRCVVMANAVRYVACL